MLNGAALNNLGPLVETVSGRSRFLAVYTVAAVAGVTASYLGSPHLSLGSSGQTGIPVARACKPSCCLMVAVLECCAKIGQALSEHDMHMPSVQKSAYRGKLESDLPNCCCDSVLRS